MGKKNRITENEKVLPHSIGNYPDMPVKELLTCTTYRWERTVLRKIKELREHHILRGPLYDINYTKLCKNPLHKLLCIVESNQGLGTVISFLKEIKSLLWTFPVLSSHKRVLNAGFFSTNDAAMASLLQLLKDNNVITDYRIRAFSTKRMIDNPNLFGDFNPPLTNLLERCHMPDMSLLQYDTEWNECDLTILPHLRGGTKLIEILRKENLHKQLTYEQVKYARKKMIKNELIEKRYIFTPFPVDNCVEFQMFMNVDSALAPRIVYNFAKGERVYKQYALFEEWGTNTVLASTSCKSHPLFLRDLMRKLDEVDEIKETEIYLMRSYSKKYSYFSPPDFSCFDFHEQTLKYPYAEYEEKIKEKIERELIVSV